jgi:formylglycine-generating enzyme required for sulfatase activity
LAAASLAAVGGVDAALPGSDAVADIGSSGGVTMIKRLGAGSFGEVWRASTSGGGFEVAVKQFFHAITHEAAQRELESLEAVRVLRHPYLLTTQSFWIHESRLYIIMELADKCLGDRLKECQKEGEAAIPPRELFGYLRESAEALDYLHKQGVMHRDIKPENILLLEGHVKVADFGLAKLLSAQRSMTASGSGTPLYMPPEVWQGKISPNSDQYSLAETYAELRLGRRVFHGTQLIELMRDQLERDPDLAGLPDAEQQVIKKAMAKKSDERFNNCMEFARALQAALGPLLAPEPLPPGVGPARDDATAELDDSVFGKQTIGRDAPELRSQEKSWQRVGRSALKQQAPPNLGYVWAAALLLALGVAGYFGWLVLSREPEINAPLPPTWDAAQVPVHAGEAGTALIQVHRNSFHKPVRFEVKDPPPEIRLASPQIEIPANSEVGHLEFTVADEAEPRHVHLTLTSSEIATPLDLDLLILPLATLPEGYRKAEGAKVLQSMDKRKYYSAIQYTVKDGTESGMPVIFQAVPKARASDEPTFYIMRDKVSNGQFGKYWAAATGFGWRASVVGHLAAGHGPVILWTASTWVEPLKSTPYTAKASPYDKTPGWAEWEFGAESIHRVGDGFKEKELGVKNPNMPVMRVTAIQAHRFARWLNGLLPTVREWDQAAGRFRADAREGPLPEPWESIKDDEFKRSHVGLNRKALGPMALTEDTIDISPFGVRHMAGNGKEWTNTMADPQGLTLVDCLSTGFPPHSAVAERGRSYQFQDPLLFADLVDAGGMAPPDLARADLGFRIVIHP